MYGSIRYGSIEYGIETEQLKDKINLYRPNLLNYLPPPLKEIKEFKIWDKIVGDELAVLNFTIENLLKQCFIDTATWGLSYWEKEFGINTNANKSYEESREILKAKIRGQGTVTKKLIKNTAEAFSGGEVEIIEHPESYYFIIKFIGIRGIPKNLGAFKDMLEQIKPAHLDYKFEYTYTTWNMLKQNRMIWKDKNTWYELKTFK